MIDQLHDVSIFSDLIESERECRICSAKFAIMVPRAKPSSGPIYCGPCAISRAEKADRRHRISAAKVFLANSGIPASYQRWSTSKASDIGSDKLLSWLQERANQSVWIGGGNGTGKTHTVMYCASQQVINEGVTCRAIRCSSWFRKQSALRAGDWRTRDRATFEFKIVRQCKILVMDDLGKEKMSETKAELLYDLIDFREREGMTTWITSNRGGEALKARLNGNGAHDHGDAVLARLIRMIPPQNIIGGKEK